MSTRPATGRSPIPAPTLIVLAMCGGLAPMAIDAYVAGLPQMSRELGSSASATQLTLTGFMVPLGLMQLVIGPLSDQMGRRRLMLIGLAGTGVSAIGCALAPTIHLLVAARVLQGAFGAAWVVLSRAVIADLGRGVGMAKAFALLMSIQSVAPVVAPVIGGLIIPVFTWRGVFWFLAGFTALLCVGAALLIPETLPAESRRAGGVRSALADMRHLLGQRRFMSGVLMFVAAFAIMFSYISASSFVLQGIVGLTQAQYSTAFSINSVMLLVASLVSGRVLGGKVSPQRVVTVAGAGSTMAVLWLTAAVLLFSSPGWMILSGFFLLVTCQGFIFPNLAAIVVEAAGERSGSGSALMGASQMVVAACVAPLTGIGNGNGNGTTAVPMIVVMLTAATVMAVTFLRVRRLGPPDVLR